MLKTFVVKMSYFFIAAMYMNAQYQLGSWDKWV